MPVKRYEQRDAVLREMGYATYAAYLRSPLWAKIKRRLFAVCKICPCGEPATEIHHRTYKRRYLEGRGKIHSYLIPICRACHQRIEFDGDKKRSLGWANSELDSIREEGKLRGVVLPRKKRRRRKRK